MKKDDIYGTIILQQCIICSIIVRNVVMKVMTASERILNIARGNNGVVTSGEVTAGDIPRRVLSDMTSEGLLIRVSRGIYLLPDAWEDEWLLMQYRYSKGIYSHETALYLHGYSDRTTECFIMTFPRGYHRKKEKGELIIDKYAVKDIYKAGIVVVDSPTGHEIRTYDLEKTLCDIVRGNEGTSIEIVNSAMKQYAKDKRKNMHKLMKYAKLLRVEKKITNYMEVLL